MTLTKICGLTTPDTLDAALDGGAAFVGAVVFPKSPRHIPPLHAATLFDRARGRAKIVAVLVDPDDVLLTEVALILRPDLIQLHGHETPQRAAQARRLTGAGIIKALPIRDEADFASVADWTGVADHLLFDAKPPKGSDLPGGVGASFDWRLMQNRALPANWFLAGGLSPENLTEAVRISGAPMVDVSSGVESAPGVKDPDLIHAFLEAVSRS
ncbi:phosphoribosylanthranilate isomerase [Brevundimonas naejangsanensis]|uniref:N-(5'-phosphoribosyl)anthranilate isomerase n=1 Tax=Brevundimonas naejangsanensis TaxID=588932 RepID=A0A494RDS1_9CAUL|nr:phosphoribosylanthranilate isomerase [Brevundimonas naejangsanensis]AYG94488.1 phosphoribosylanthranilate isomerase [Brevundimonas naejangsanensis]